VKKLIVYHLAPGTPEPVRSALLEGARWWAEAFEAAGFEDAFRVEIRPPDVHPLDARYHVINWVHRSTRGWSTGDSVVDPRTGEILKGVVTLGSLRVRQDYPSLPGLDDVLRRLSEATAGAQSGSARPTRRRSRGRSSAPSPSGSCGWRPVRVCHRCARSPASRRPAGAQPLARRRGARPRERGARGPARPGHRALPGAAAAPGDAALGSGRPARPPDRRAGPRVPAHPRAALLATVISGYFFGFAGAGGLRAASPFRPRRAPTPGSRPAARHAA
jgi:hypothetical protein